MDIKIVGKAGYIIYTRKKTDKKYFVLSSNITEDNNRILKEVRRGEHINKEFQFEFLKAGKINFKADYVRFCSSDIYKEYEDYIQKLMFQKIKTLKYKGKPVYNIYPDNKSVVCIKDGKIKAEFRTRALAAKYLKIHRNTLNSALKLAKRGQIRTYKNGFSPILYKDFLKSETRFRTIL